MNNVVGLNGDPNPQAVDSPAVSEELVEAVEELLGQVKSGRVVALSVAGLRYDGGIYNRMGWGAGVSALPLIGAASLTLQDLINAVNDSCEHSEI